MTRHVSAFKHASVAMCVWILSNVGLIVTVIVNAPEERKNWVAISVGLALNLALLTYVALLARRVRRGKSIGRAVSVLSMYGFIWVVIVVWVFAGGGGPQRPVLISQLVLLGSFLIAVTMLIRAGMRARRG